MKNTQCRSLGSFVLSRAEAQKVHGAARESDNECTRNTLKHSTCPHKWREILKGSIFGVKLSISALRGPGGCLVLSPAEKATRMGSQFVSIKAVSYAVRHTLYLLPSF